MSERCEKCRYFVDADAEVGDCHRYAPKPKWSCELPEEEGPDDIPSWRVHWPEVGRNYWCGEFKRKAD